MHIGHFFCSADRLRVEKKKMICWITSGMLFHHPPGKGNVERVTASVPPKHPGLLRNAKFGAEITVAATIAGKQVVQRRVLSPTRSYLSQNEPVARFGLGDATGAVRVDIDFPGGTRQSETLEAGKRHRIRKPQSVSHNP